METDGWVVYAKDAATAQEIIPVGDGFSHEFRSCLCQPKVIFVRDPQREDLALAQQRVHRPLDSRQTI